MWGKTHFDKSRISAITDEIGKSTDESIEFAHKYGLTNVEIRNVPGGKEYYTLPEAQIKADALRFQKEGLKVSFVNTGLLKFTWPGTEPARKRNETPEAREKRLATEKARGNSIGNFFSGLFGGGSAQGSESAPPTTTTVVAPTPLPNPGWV